MAQSAPAQETLRVAIPLFPTAAFPLLVAPDRGFFRNEGLTVEPIRINSAPTTYQALISGDVHAVSGAPTGKSIHGAALGQRVRHRADEVSWPAEATAIAS
ncbi:MAG TPA: ABC transporter substrate-binding protein [Candidatus Limnocylindria bacterium]|nr:ABC transporter substrate-binding protein [Candidatus Limnocylindria bacterium]